MSRGILIIDKTVSQRHATLLATAAVTTAQSPLTAVFGASPGFEIEPSPEQAERIDNVLSNETAVLKNLLGEGIDPKDPQFFDRVILRIAEAGELAPRGYQGNSRALLLSLLKRFRLRRLPTEPLSKLLEPFEIKVVELNFQKINQFVQGSYVRGLNYSTKRKYDRIGEKVKILCNQGDPLDTLEAGPTDDRATENLIGKMITEGFGDLTGQVGLRVTADGCKFLFNNKLIARTKRVSEGLEKFRDAAVWLWLKALAEEYRIEANGKPSEADSALGSTAQDSALGSTAQDSAMGSTAQDSALGSTAQDSAIDTVTPRDIGLGMYLQKINIVVPEFPEKVPEEIKDMVTKLEEEGMLQEAKTYVKENSFVVNKRDWLRLRTADDQVVRLRSGLDRHWYWLIARLFRYFVKDFDSKLDWNF